MIQKTELTNLNTLYADSRLYELFDTMDQLHSAASENDLQKFTTLNQHELVELLKDFIFTAQETIREIDEQQSYSRTSPVVLQFVKAKQAQADVS